MPPPHPHRIVAGLAGLALVVGMSGCRATQDRAQKPSGTIRLAMTTSTEASGLLGALLPEFQKAYEVNEVQVLSVGTGRALKLGENGDVDVVLVHARDAEDLFVAEGHGVGRRDVMYNDFVLVGPPQDPAGVSGSESVAGAFRAIAEHQALFISRGDDSGTHKKELAIWRGAGIEPEGESYASAGQGMGAVLIMADETRAYTLTDRGTYISFRDRIDLPILYEGDPDLCNPYGVIAVNPDRHPEVNHAGAMAFIDWLTSPEGQAVIGAYRRDDETLFHPAVHTTE